MAVENIQVEVSQVSTFAVCCTSNLTLEDVNNFLAQVWREEERTATEFTPPTHVLTVVHDLKTFFWGATEKLKGEDLETVLQSPFAGLIILRLENCL
ncbi:hypothetical protein Slin15195_G017330 [Septoria linicola]|uniref:Uncharacterized protein n=1 Tax=Septoria linicola TaxID=215465 RepID=A0A9Q9AIH6_9PEZI|nr:hypothetical protein Slin15195_G017330 [Septoria linicola]